MSFELFVLFFMLTDFLEASSSAASVGVHQKDGELWLELLSTDYLFHTDFCILLMAGVP